MNGIGTKEDVYKHYLKIIEENKQLRQLLKDSIYILNEYKHCFNVKHHIMAANIINKANEVLK